MIKRHKNRKIDFIPDYWMEQNLKYTLIPMGQLYRKSICSPGMVVIDTLNMYIEPHEA